MWGYIAYCFLPLLQLGSRFSPGCRPSFGRCGDASLTACSVFLPLNSKTKTQCCLHFLSCSGKRRALPPHQDLDQCRPIRDSFILQTHVPLLGLHGTSPQAPRMAKILALLLLALAAG